MVTSYKSNDNRGEGKSILPLPPKSNDSQSKVDMEIYARFMRHLRMVPNSQMEIKILSAIQFTADMLDIGDALVAKTLVDCGLRASRKAFPSDYLEFVDRSLLRTGWHVGGPTSGAVDLKEFWDTIGADKFASFHHDVHVASEPVLVS